MLAFPGRYRRRTVVFSRFWFSRSILGVRYRGGGVHLHGPFGGGVEGVSTTLIRHGLHRLVPLVEFCPLPVNCQQERAAITRKDKAYHTAQSMFASCKDENT